MTEAAQSPLEVVRQFMKLMEPLNYDEALKLISEDCEYTNPPPFGTVRGPKGVRAVLEPFFAPTLDNEFKVVRESVAGPVVFLERLDRHLFGETWVELPVTGVYEVRGGLITHWRDYFDTPTIMSQIPSA